MIKQITDIAELVLKVFGIIGGLAAAFIFLRKWWKGYTIKLNMFFARQWGNEGNIGDFPTHYLELDINADGRNINGSFNVRKSGEDHTWHGVGLFGKRYFSKVKCTIVHVRHGQVLTYGKVTLKKKGKNLKWELKNGVADFFPKETILF